MLLRDETKCFAFLAGHESFAAAEGAIGIARTANKARKEPLRVILNGLGKDAAQIISRINGFTYVKTDYDFKAGKLNIVEEIQYSDGDRAAVKCYGANDVLEGVAIMPSQAANSLPPAHLRLKKASKNKRADTHSTRIVEKLRILSIKTSLSTSRTFAPALGSPAR